jgi:putative peptidoglycan lipid II flippase
VGLLFVAAQRIGTQGLYALKDYRGPATIALATLLLNIGLSLALMKPYGTGGLALANGLSSLAGLVLLVLRLRPRLPGFTLGPALSGWGLAVLAAAPMALAAWQGAAWLGLGHTLGRGALALRLLPLIAACAGIYALAAWGLGHPEARALAERVRRRG